MILHSMSCFGDSFRCEQQVWHSSLYQFLDTFSVWVAPGVDTEELSFLHDPKTVDRQMTDTPYCRQAAIRPLTGGTFRDSAAES